MDFESAPGEESVRWMENEVSELLRPSGVSLDWSRVAENRGTHPFAGLVVLKFKGACKVEGLPERPDSARAGEVEALGFTQVDHGRVLPYSEVECDRVRKALSYLGPGAGKKERQRALGVAMANVVAHELYHVLAATTSHAERGIAKASQPLEELILPGKLAFSEEDSFTISEALRRHSAAARR